MSRGADLAHPKAPPIARRFGTRAADPCALALASALAIHGCAATVPSDSVRLDVSLPVPSRAEQLPPPERLLDEDYGEKFVITPLSLVQLAFDRQPDIKSSFQRFKSEEARYDFFYSSRDSLTPRLRLRNDFSEDRGPEEVFRDRTHSVEFGVEKLFFDTTRMDLSVGYRSEEFADDLGNAPFVAANIRYPLWASREKLERASEDIFRQNELYDAQLAYIQLVRSSLQSAMFRFYEVVDLQRQVGNLASWVADLEELSSRIDESQSPTRQSDRQRLNSALARVRADLRVREGRLDVVTTRFKSSVGLPFHADVELVSNSFNPFVGFSHQELLQLSIETDPEIATLRNSVRNAEVQLDLARRGKWDIALLMSGQSDLEGRGFEDGNSDWALSVGLDVSAVDPRVTTSLSAQAQANISRFQQSIAARENAIYADVFEPLIRIETVSASRDELLEKLPQYRADYDAGVSDYVAGNFSIDNLLERRSTLFDQQQEVSRLTFLVGANVAELCAATGKFFELLSIDNDDIDVGPLPNPVP